MADAADDNDDDLFEDLGDRAGASNAAGMQADGQRNVKSPDPWADWTDDEEELPPPPPSAFYLEFLKAKQEYEAKVAAEKKAVAEKLEAEKAAQRAKIRRKRKEERERVQEREIAREKERKERAKANKPATDGFDEADDDLFAELNQHGADKLS